MNSLLIKFVSYLADPKSHLICWGIASCYIFYKNKMEVLNSKIFYLFLQTGLIMFVCGILKVSFGRARPFLLEENIVGFFYLNAKHAYLSFPSSHCAISAAFAFSLRRFFNVSRLIYLFPLLIAFSRLALMKHFATDVLTGLFIGIGMGNYLPSFLNMTIKRIQRIWA